MVSTFPFLRLLKRLELDPCGCAFFLGAGCSLTAGIPLESEDAADVPSIATRIRQMVYERYTGQRKANPRDVERWLKKKKWLQEQSTFYTDWLSLMEMTLEEGCRFRSQLLQGCSPAPGHYALASLVAAKAIHYILTSNFDFLIERALGDMAIDVQVVTLDEAENLPALIDSLSPLVIRLHTESAVLPPCASSMTFTDAAERVRRVLEVILENRSLVVVGYAGRDDFIMAPIAAWVSEVAPRSVQDIYWVVVKGTPLPSRVAAWQRQRPDRVWSIETVGSDVFLSELCARVIT